MAKMASVSRSTVQRIWGAHGLQPHRVTMFELSTDPAFVEQLTDVGQAAPEPAAQGGSLAALQSGCSSSPPSSSSPPPGGTGSSLGRRCRVGRFGSSGGVLRLGLNCAKRASMSWNSLLATAYYDCSGSRSPIIFWMALGRSLASGRELNTPRGGTLGSLSPRLEPFEKLAHGLRIATRLVGLPYA